MMPINIIKKNAQRIAGPDKRLGQNFILDTNITRKIVNFSSITPLDHVLEIGPGPGGLSFAILEKSPHAFTLIEKDSRCLPGLEELISMYQKTCQVDIVCGDALKVLDTKLCVPTIVIANLPYNISSLLLMALIRQHTMIKEMVLMFQKEMALRLVAKTSTKAYGRLSIMTQAFFKPELVYHLPPSVFTPPPKVDSAVVKFTPLNHIDHQEKIIPILENITHTFFSNRRKTVGHIVKKYFNQNKIIQEFLTPYLHLRPENLDVQTYITLCAKTFL